MHDGEPFQPLYADWVWISQDETSDGYRILRASQGPIDAGSFAWQYVPGVPGSSVSLSDPPPWLTFGAHSSTAGPVISASRLNPPEAAADEAGRAVWPRLFVTCPYGDAAARRVSYQALAAALPATPEGVGPSPLRLTPASQPLKGETGLAAAVHDYGFDRMALIAAALLDDRRVAITGAGPLGLAERLRLLDAAVALLPYGFRAALSASSAVDPVNSKHTIRLVITDVPYEDSQVVIRLGTERQLAFAPSAVAAEYLRMLRERADGSSITDIADVVGHLWEATTACSFKHPEEALAILRPLHHKKHLSNRVITGQGTEEDVAEYLIDRAQHWAVERERNPDAMRTLLLTLLRSGSPTAVDALLRSWRHIVEDISALANAGLNHGDPELARLGLAVARHAPSSRPEDELLGRLLVPGEGQVSEPFSGPIKYRVALLREYPVPRPGEFMFTCDQLRYLGVTKWQARLVRTLLLADSGGDGPLGARAAKWVTWLCRSDFPKRECPQWVRALGYPLTDSADAAAADSILAVIRDVPDWLLVLLQVAAQFERLPKFLAVPGLDLTLIGIAVDWSAPGLTGAQAHPGSAATLGRLLNVPAQRHQLRPPVAASLDIVQLALGDVPRYFPLRDPGADPADYLAGLQRGLDYLGSRPDVAGLVTHGILDWAILKQGAAHDDFGRRQGVAPGAMRLIDAWSEDESRSPALARFLADVLGRSSVLLDAESLAATDFNRQQAGAPGSADEVAVELMKRITFKVWSRLMDHDPRLVPLGAVKRLEAAMAAVYEDPLGALRRRTHVRFDEQTGEPHGHITNSKPAVAIWHALHSGLSPQGILTVIGREQDHAPVGRRMSEGTLLRVILEVRSMIMYYAPPEIPFVSPANAQAMGALAESRWLEFLQQVMGRQAALGGTFASNFLAENTAYANDGETSYHILRQAFPLHAGPLRRKFAARKYEKWQRRLQAQMSNLDRGYWPGRPPAVTGAVTSAEAITPGPAPLGEETVSPVPGGGLALPPPAGAPAARGQAQPEGTPSPGSRPGNWLRSVIRVLRRGQRAKTRAAGAIEPGGQDG